MNSAKTVGTPQKPIPLIQGSFQYLGLPTKLTLYPTSLTFTNKKMICTYIINFDYCYDVVEEDSRIGLVIYCPEKILFLTTGSLEIWEKALLQIMKRRNFHNFFKSLKKLGQGNFASVYKAVKFSNSKQFAVKAFQKQSTFKSKDGKQALQNEINILRSLKHPNIMGLEGVYQTDNSVYLIMELAQCKNLGEILDQQENIPVGIRKKIMKGILYGLSELQKRKIVHRDIKPQNLMVNSNYEVKIVDFGLATHSQAKQHLYLRCGTPGFVAPEILSIRKDHQNAQIRPISDVFSAGAIFYQMVYGKYLFQGQQDSDILQNNHRCKIQLPNNHDHQPNNDEVKLIRGMLQKNPQNRITASQALKSHYFVQLREKLSQISTNQINKSKNLIKYSVQLRNRYATRDKNENQL